AFLAVALAATAAGARQQSVAPDIFVAAFTSDGHGLEVPNNASHNTGYDNQPSFLANSRAVLFASNHDGKQTDIYTYDVRSRNLSRVTRTDESEYSPQPMPDGRGISAVRIGAG